jgi:hypothetical protein
MQGKRPESRIGQGRAVPVLRSMRWPATRCKAERQDRRAGGLAVAAVPAKPDRLPWRGVGGPVAATALVSVRLPARTTLVVVTVAMGVDETRDVQVAVAADSLVLEHG